MLNPFRGIMQTIEAENIDAASVDGMNWGLYITDESAYSFIDLNSVAPFHSAEIKYGEWSEKGGLVRAPSLPSMNQQWIRERGEELLGMVQTHNASVPFPLADRYERWLLDDEQGWPVVLLESAYGPNEVTYHSNTLWRVGNLALRDFKGRDVPAGKAGERLQSMVNGQCTQGRTRWVLREADGGGTIVARPGEEDERSLSPERFPKYGIREQWPDADVSRLVTDYLHWLSPWLLIMFHHDPEGMERLVRQAVQYPRRLFRIRRLLPAELLARKEVKSALVQAELSRDD